MDIEKNCHFPQYKNCHKLQNINIKIANKL